MFEIFNKSLKFETTQTRFRTLDQSECCSKYDWCFVINKAKNWIHKVSLVIDVASIVSSGLFGVIIDSLVVVDYMEGKNLNFTPWAPVSAMLVVLVLIQLLLFSFDWYFLIHQWKSELEESEMPNIHSMVQACFRLIIHDAPRNILWYFYVARYKPFTVPMNFFVFLEVLIGLVFLLRELYTSVCALPVLKQEIENAKKEVQGLGVVNVVCLLVSVKV